MSAGEQPREATGWRRATSAVVPCRPACAPASAVPGPAPPAPSRQLPGGERDRGVRGGDPATAALGAPAAVPAVLGIVVTVLTGLRQVLRPQEGWVRVGTTSLALEREVVRWSAGTSPYDGEDADLTLVRTVEDLVAQEAGRGASRRSAAAEPFPPRLDGRTEG
ncbi:DUF4231 domain-containing protein [Streptomyces griseoaurantiacus]|uniref:DUF4231 domain-containing protein n=1 Tax=Streptomyces griseoaurantiacus TaxID=68213 RepID=UPI00296FE611